ncbi:MAG TPA: DUF4340 domain-containing protein [Terriglobales bacterium]|jgi:hypothetical protein|nr:DUF4340 domain-containing protein [Terriglobales bacterium]
MKLRGLMVAIVVLAGLTGALYWSNRQKPAGTAEASADAPPKILTLKQEDISKIDLKKKGGDELVLAKDGSGKWQITAPQALGVEQSTVSPLLSSLSTLTSERLVEEKASDLGQYGLSDPALVATITEKNNKTHELLLGDQTPAGSAVYAKLDGDPRIFIIASYNKGNIDKSVNDLRDKRLLTVDADKISKVELIAKKEDIEFGRNKDGWQIVKPKPLRADGPQVEELVRTLSDARMDLSGAAQDAKTIMSAFAAFASAAPVATARVTAESGTQELQVRKNKDDYYAKSSAVEGVYKVAGTVGKGLDKGLEDFRNKKLFDLGFSEPNKIEIHDGAKNYFLTRGGDNWWNGSGKKLDIESAQSVVDKIRDLSASKFVDSGFTMPAIELTVTSNDGKKVEKVQVARKDAAYIARREGDVSLYEVDAQAVTGLEQAAEEMKIAAAPPSK